jgi:hypothetical protein
MTQRGKGPHLAPSVQGIAIVRERLKAMGFQASDATARSLIEAVLAVEGPRLYAEARGQLENSLEIIRDTAESALTALQEERPVPPVPTTTINERRPPGPSRAVLQDDMDDDEPRPVFKRPRR